MPPLLHADTYIYCHILRYVHTVTYCDVPSYIYSVRYCHVYTLVTYCHMCSCPPATAEHAPGCEQRADCCCPQHPQTCPEASACPATAAAVPRKCFPCVCSFSWEQKTRQAPQQQRTLPRGPQPVGCNIYYTCTTYVNLKLLCQANGQQGRPTGRKARAGGRRLSEWRGH